jgi:hypothetical protein
MRKTSLVYSTTVNCITTCCGDSGGPLQGYVIQSAIVWR